MFSGLGFIPKSHFPASIFTETRCSRRAYIAHLESDATKWEPFFNEIGQRWHLRDMAAILKKNDISEKFSIVPSCSPHQLTLRYQFFVEIGQVEIFAIQPFWKKMVTQNKISIVPSFSLHQITPRYQFSLKSDKVDITHDLAAILKINGSS